MGISNRKALVERTKALLLLLLLPWREYSSQTGLSSTELSLASPGKISFAIFSHFLNSVVLHPGVDSFTAAGLRRHLCSLGSRESFPKVGNWDTSGQSFWLPTWQGECIL